MALGDFLARLGGGAAPQEPAPAPTPAAPSRDDLGAALERVEAMVADGAVPSCVTARVERVTHVVRDTIPRLGVIRGSANAYSVMATATDYLPEALGGYLRLPRRFADSRPVDGGRTSLMVLVDQLDLLGATMDQVFDAVCRDDATALVAHGRFLEEKFGHAYTGGMLDTHGALSVPAMPGSPAPAAAPGHAATGGSTTRGESAEAGGVAEPGDSTGPGNSGDSTAAGDSTMPGDLAERGDSAEAPAQVPPTPQPPPGPTRSVLDLDAPLPTAPASHDSAPPTPAEAKDPDPPRLAPPTWT